MTVRTLVHCSDLHFGRDVDLRQVEALVRFTADRRPDAVVVTGDITQRARHGEFQAALAFVQRLQASAPVLVLPGNHDVTWWQTPFHLRGAAPLYVKYRRWFGAELTPVLELPGLVIAGVLTSHGVAAGSMTWNLRDLAVKGHLPASEAARVAELFRRAPAGAVRVVALHHNVLRGQISNRWGLARPLAAQQALRATGADLVLCSHDHQEGAGAIDGALAVSTSSTHTSRTRGHRPSAFNVVTIDDRAIRIEHQCWDAEAGAFRPREGATVARPGVARAAAPAGAGVAAHA